jgi:hypothetical protein
MDEITYAGHHLSNSSDAAAEVERLRPRLLGTTWREAPRLGSVTVTAFHRDPDWQWNCCDYGWHD